MKLCLTSQIKKWVYDLWETRNSIKTKKSQKQRSNGYRQITSPSKAILLKRRSRGCKTNEATFALSCLWSHCFRTNEQKFQIKKNPCERVQETLRRSEDVRRKYFSDSRLSAECGLGLYGGFWWTCFWWKCFWEEWDLDLEATTTSIELEACVASDNTANHSSRGR